MLDPQEGPKVCKFFIVMGLFSFHLRYLQVILQIWKKQDTDQSTTERRSCCFHNQLDLCWGELASIDTNGELEAGIEPQINTNVESFLLVFLFIFINCFAQRNHREITFLMLNRFCLLRKTFHSQFLMNNIKLDGIPSKIKWKIFYIVFQGTSYKKLFLVLLTYMSLYISRYLFLQLFFKFIQQCLKNNFCHKFSVFNRFTETPHPPNGQNLLCVKKNFCQYSLTFFKESLLDFASAQISHQKKKRLNCSVFLNIWSKFCLQSFKTNNPKLIILIKF